MCTSTAIWALRNIPHMHNAHVPNQRAHICAQLPLHYAHHVLLLLPFGTRRKRSPDRSHQHNRHSTPSHIFAVGFRLPHFVARVPKPVSSMLAWPAFLHICGVCLVVVLSLPPSNCLFVSPSARERFSKHIYVLASSVHLKFDHQSRRVA